MTNTYGHMINSVEKYFLGEVFLKVAIQEVK